MSENIEQKEETHDHRFIRIGLLFISGVSVLSALVLVGVIPQNRAGYMLWLVLWLSWLWIVVTRQSTMGKTKNNKEERT